MRLRCHRCGQSVSTEVPADTVVRAWIECPECIEKTRVPPDVIDHQFAEVEQELREP